MNIQLGIGVVGCGYWGIKYVRAFSQLAGACVVAACDQRPQSLREVRKLAGDAHLTTDIQKLLELESVGAVVVATHASSHFDIVRQCLLAGKHVLVEKPIAASAAEAEELVSIAEARQITLMVGHTFLYNPSFRAVKEYLQQGTAGRIYYLYARRTNMGPIRQDVNVFWDLAPHDISMFNHLLDATPVWVSAVGTKLLSSQNEDAGFIALGYPGDVIGHIHVSWVDPHKVREVIVVASDQRIEFDDLRMEDPVRVFHKGVSVAEQNGSDGETSFRLRNEHILSPHVESSEPLSNQCNHFLYCAAHRSRPLSGGPEGRDVVRVLEAIDVSASHRGMPVELASGGSHVLTVSEP